MFMGRNKSQAITFLQEKMNYASRPDAEIVYEYMLKEGAISESPEYQSVFLEDENYINEAGEIDGEKLQKKKQFR